MHQNKYVKHLRLIVHVLKFSRGAVIYLPAGPSGHIVSSNYDLYSEFYMGWVFTIILYILVRLLFYFTLSFWKVMDVNRLTGLYSHALFFRKQGSPM